MDDNKNQVPKPTIKATVKKPNILKELITYAIKEEIEPRSKEIVRNAITGTFDMMNNGLNKMVDKWIYPEGNGPKRVTKSNGIGSYVPHTNYTTKIYKSDSPINTKKPSISSRSSIDIGYIYVDTKEQAHDIITNLIEAIENYGKAKVSDLYDQLTDENGNKIPTTFADVKYGWTDADALGYHQEGGQYLLDLPKPINIENV